MAKVRIKTYQCPFCNGTQFVKGYQAYHGAVISMESSLRTQYLYHDICLTCGNVARSYVLEPEKLLKRSSRKYVTD